MQFLNASTPSAPYVYGAMFAGHVVLFAMIWVLFRLRDAVRGTKLVASAPFNGPNPRKTE
jgi:hypothetical protein